jgi:hypothetical protein
MKKITLSSIILIACIASIFAQVNIVPYNTVKSGIWVSLPNQNNSIANAYEAIAGITIKKDSVQTQVELGLTEEFVCLRIASVTIPMWQGWNATMGKAFIKGLCNSLNQGNNGYFNGDYPGNSGGLYAHTRNQVALTNENLSCTLLAQKDFEVILSYDIDGIAPLVMYKNSDGFNAFLTDVTVNKSILGFDVFTQAWWGKNPSDLGIFTILSCHSTTNTDAWGGLFQASKKSFTAGIGETINSKNLKSGSAFINYNVQYHGLNISPEIGKFWGQNNYYYFGTKLSVSM